MAPSAVRAGTTRADTPTGRGASSSEGPPSNADRADADDQLTGASYAPIRGAVNNKKRKIASSTDDQTHQIRAQARAAAITEFRQTVNTAYPKSVAASKWAFNAKDPTLPRRRVKASQR